MKELAEYENLPADELREKIAAVREAVGDRLTVLAHYYAPDEVVELADYVGDSLGLAKKAAASSAEAVLFCGVKFMLETADILMNRADKIAARGGKRAVVMAPDLSAGCPMADMITAEQAEDWKRRLEEHVDFAEFTPITYVNSSSATKAFCGRNGGAVCTSANAEKVVREALERRPKILFMPDSRLGKTTSLTLGVSPDEIVTWRLNRPLGGASVEKIKRAKVILWDGCCPVHQRFSESTIRAIKKNNPGAEFWVHPEAPRSIVELSDGYGSTTKLLDVVAKAKPGAVLAIGTEWKLVDRIRRQNPDKTILFPAERPSICVNMAKSTLDKAAWTLENWLDGEPINVVSTPEDVAEDAYRALESLL
ncbi:MAG: quinolinate synthase NadA [Thermoguttaceae bacterium]|nr:quinolinate synthase NadA [Thermoguttaceae bacterium]